MKNTISIIICTYNRAEILSQTLTSWLTVDQNGIDAEFIVVDNHSSDHTQKIARDFAHLCPCQFRYVYETKPGLSHARNRGIEESKGEIIAFVDDDIDFEPAWLKEIVNTFSEHREISCVGGKSIPKFATNVPSWLTDDVHSSYGSTDSGDVDKIMVFPEHPFGLNMAFRRNVFEKVGLFNPDLGRMKKCLLSNEELDIFFRINEHKMIVYYASKAILFHRIPEERMKKEWLLDRYYWQGISDVISDRFFFKRSKRYFVIRLFGVVKHLISPHGLISPFQIYKHYSTISFKNRLAVEMLLGKLRQYFFELISV